MVRSMTVAVGAAGLLASAAMAQPAAFTDLGNHTGAGSFESAVTLNAANDIQWYKVVLPPTPTGSPAFVDLWTTATGDITDCEIGIWDNSGALIANDDDNGVGLMSAISFGAGSGQTIGDAGNLGGDGIANGENGLLAGGVYWVAVGRFNVEFAANWSATSTYTGAQRTVTLNFAVNPATDPYPPSGTGSTTPTPLVAGNSAVFTVSVSPGGNPASTGITVVGNLSTLGGSATQAFNDAGQNGDVTAGDGIFSFAHTVPASQAGGATTWTFTVSDAQARSSNGTANTNVLAAGTWIEGANDAGDLPSTAQQIPGSGNLPSIVGNISSGTDVDMYAFNLCQPASFQATTADNGTAPDTQLFLFNSNGVGVAFNDDDPQGTTNISRITSAFTASLAAGTYYLAISRYNTDPVDAGGQLLWANAPFRTERAPDGPGAANPVASWTGTAVAGAYQIDFTGACLGSGGGGCAADTDDGTRTGTPDGAVTIDDLIYFLIAFEDGNLDADLDNGTRTGTTDGAVTIDDLVYFLIRFEEGC